MSTNPIRLEWTEDDEREFLRENYQAQFDDYFIRTEYNAAILYHRDYLEGDDIVI